jgi:pimeloyl-ACP methyl ester carboxylesterase
MIWTGLLIALIVAAPVALELARKKMDSAARTHAPGRFAELPQGKTHYTWFGPEDGPVVVCVHGLTSPSFVWAPLAQGLAAQGFRVLTYDLYGRGFSDRLPGPQVQRFFLRQLNDLLDDQEIDGKVVLVGYSMGGAISTAYSIARPERVRHLVLLAPAGMEPVSAPLLGAFLPLPVVGSWAMLAFYPAILRAGLRAGAERPRAMPAIIAQQDAELDWRGFVPAVTASLRGILSETLQVHHEEIAASGLPVTAIWGNEDTVIPLTAAGALRRWNPAAHQVVLRDAGHELAYTHAPEVLDILRDRLRPS